MLDIRALGMGFGAKSLFQQANLILLSNQRYGIVGANGSGKSTFLKILAQEESPAQGSVEKSNTVSIGILKQDHFRYEHHRIIDVVIQGNALLWQAMIEKEKLLAKDCLNDQEGYYLAELEETILHQNGYEAEISAQLLLIGLGIEEKHHYAPLSILSGGYKLRVLLAKVLFQQPDIMLLDEPTNHLDILSIRWLEDFLKNEFKKLLIFISHDREFLNNLATRILDIDYDTVTEYTGNYNRFMTLKEQTLIHKQHELQHTEKQIENMQRFVDRFRASASKSTQASSRLKMIERMESDKPVIKNSSVTTPYFNFAPKKPSGKLVLKAERLAKRFQDKAVLKNISFSLQRGEKCAIIGPNGVGKSTLLKILLGQIIPDQGVYEWHENVDIGYFNQDYQLNMPPNLTVWQWIEQTVQAPSQEARNILGQVLFRGQDVDKKISVLSGGESARLVLASLILQKSNALILDEPTNHLDIESIDALVKALQKFSGAVLFVSHNRYFIDHIATRIMALSFDNGVRNYHGNYHDYLSQYGKDYFKTS